MVLLTDRLDPNRQPDDTFQGPRGLEKLLALGSGKGADVWGPDIAIVARGKVVDSLSQLGVSASYEIMTLDSGSLISLGNIATTDSVSVSAERDQREAKNPLAPFDNNDSTSLEWDDKSYQFITYRLDRAYQIRRHRVLATGDYLQVNGWGNLKSGEATTLSISSDDIQASEYFSARETLSSSSRIHKWEVFSHEVDRLIRLDGVALLAGELIEFDSTVLTELGLTAGQAFWRVAKNTTPGGWELSPASPIEYESLSGKPRIPSLLSDLILESPNDLSLFPAPGDAEKALSAISKRPTIAHIYADSAARIAQEERAITEDDIANRRIFEQANDHTLWRPFGTTSAVEWTQLGGRALAPLWPGNGSATVIGRENNYYKDEEDNIVVTPPTALGQEYSLRIHSVDSDATPEERKNATATVHHWGSLDDGEGGFVWVPTISGDIGAPTATAASENTSKTITADIWVPTVTTVSENTKTISGDNSNEPVVTVGLRKDPIATVQALKALVSPQLGEERMLLRDRFDYRFDDIYIAQVADAANPTIDWQNPEYKLPNFLFLSDDNTGAWYPLQAIEPNTQWLGSQILNTSDGWTLDSIYRRRLYGEDIKNFSFEYYDPSDTNQTPHFFYVNDFPGLVNNTITLPEGYTHQMGQSGNGFYGGTVVLLDITHVGKVTVMMGIRDGTDNVFPDDNSLMLVVMDAGISNFGGIRNVRINGLLADYLEKVPTAARFDS